MFIRTKTFKGRTYYYLVKNRREGKKVYQKVLRYLGAKRPSPEELVRIIDEIKGAEG